MKKPFSYYLGNLLILISLGCLAYIFYPLVVAYLFPQKPPPPSSRAFALWIPKIHASGQIVTNVDPWNENSYGPALKKGIALAKGYALPGAKGVSYLFAHSSGPPWEQTRYNTVFLRLGELTQGDLIVIWRDNKEYDYHVVSKEIVNPDKIAAVTKAKGTELILQTCSPIGTDWQRLLVFARPN